MPGAVSYTHLLSSIISYWIWLQINLFEPWKYPRLVHNHFKLLPILFIWLSLPSLFCAVVSYIYCFNRDVYKRQSQYSALCVYSLKAIRRKFMQNIKTCFTGMGNRGLDFISPSHGCILTVSRIKIAHRVLAY